MSTPQLSPTDIRHLSPADLRALGVTPKSPRVKSLPVAVDYFDALGGSGQFGGLPALAYVAVAQRFSLPPNLLRAAIALRRSKEVAP